MGLVIDSHPIRFMGKYSSVTASIEPSKLYLKLKKRVCQYYVKMRSPILIFPLTAGLPGS